MIPKPELLKYFEEHKRTEYKAGEVIVRGGDTPSGVYLIESGMVKVFGLTDRGEENLHLFYGPGELFPLIWAFLDISYEVTYQTLEPTVVWRMKKEEFTSCALRDATFAYLVAEQLASQLLLHSIRVDNLEFGTAYERVVYRLLFLAHRFGTRQGTEVVIDAPITHQDIANTVNVARETASREIERLERKGLVKRQNARIVLPDVAKLTAELHDNINLMSWGLPGAENIGRDRDPGSC